MFPISKSADLQSRAGERGSAALIVMIFMAFAALTVLTYTASNNLRQTRNLDNSRSKIHEKWNARSEANVLAQIIAKDAPTQIDADVRLARSQCHAGISLPIFDAAVGAAGGAAGGESEGSSPAAAFEDGSLTCRKSEGLAYTSLFGNFSNWRDARIPLFETTGHQNFSLNAENVKIVQLDEIYRRTLSDSDTAYAVRYIVEAKVGNYRTRTNGEIILGTNLPTCGTSAALEVTPASVVRGNQVEMNITYAYADKIDIYNSARTLIHSQIVSEQSTSQTYVYRFSPASSDTFTVTASSSGGCQAQSASVVITVTDPLTVCPRVLDFSASSTLINAGESVTLSWNVQDAAAVTFEGAAVAATGSQTFTLNADRTFTLTGRDPANSCPFTQTITVKVRPAAPPSCAAQTPQISSFTASPGSIAIGGNSTLSWNAGGLAAGGSVQITGANGLSQTVPANGTLVANPPAVSGDYTYTLKAENVCPDGTKLTGQAIVIISVRACPPPSISAFSVNPSTVTAGGNQLVTFSWNISGTVDAVSISNGVGSGLPASGTVDVTQPQTTTTYTITTIGCGVTTTRQVTVIVNSCPPPTVDNFVSNPSSVVIGGNQTVRLSWNLGGTIDSVNISGIGNVTGTYIDIAQPQTTTTYTITANGCGQAAQAQVTVAATSCPAPTIDGFAPNPPAVIAGGNQTVRLAWSLSGTVDSISISGIGAVSGNYIDIAQPQTTTAYTLTITGCGQSQSATTNIVVNPAAGRQYAETGGSSRYGSYTVAQARAEIATNPDGRISIEIVVYANGVLNYLEVRQNGVLLKRFNNIAEYYALGFGGAKFVPLVPFDPNQPLTITFQVTSSINAGGIVETSVLNTSSANRALPNSCIYYNGFSSPGGNFTCGYEGTNLSYVAASSIASY